MLNRRVGGENIAEYDKKVEDVSFVSALLLARQIIIKALEALRKH